MGSVSGENNKDVGLQPACLVLLKRIETLVGRIIEAEKANNSETEKLSKGLHSLARAFIEALGVSEIPSELREEVRTRVQGIINLLPGDNLFLQSLRGEVRSLKRRLQRQVFCGRCGRIGELLPGNNPSPDPNFKCGYCGHETRFLLRREMMDLDDPAEGELALRIAGESLL